MRVPDENGLDKVEAMKQNYYKLRLDCLVILGGNGTQKTANLLREEGLNIIHLPKTIDNDIYGTDMTFGFQSAVNIATDAIDCIHTTAASHNRVFIVEVMGHKVGWLTLYAGIAGGADIILIPEIPYDIDKVVEAIDKQNQSRKRFYHSGSGRGCDLQRRRSSFQEGIRKRNWQTANILPFPMSWQTRSWKRPEWKCVSPFRVIHSEAEVPARMTVFFPRDWARQAAQLILKEEYGYMVGIVNGKM